VAVVVTLEVLVLHDLASTPERSTGKGASDAEELRRVAGARLGAAEKGSRRLK
jgi:hypothetical protein